MQFGFFTNEINLLWDFMPCIYGFELKGRHAHNVAARMFLPAFGTLGAGLSYLLVKYGKRKVLIAQCLLILASCGIIVIQNYAALMIARAMRGIAFGVSTVIAPMFVKEITNRVNRGPLIMLVQL